MSNEIKSAIRATIDALRTNVATSNVEPGYRQLVERASVAAERAIGPDEIAAWPDRRRSR